MPVGQRAGIAAAAVGILGGLALLVALVIEIPTAVNGPRIVLFHLGVIAVGLGTYPWHARVSTRLAVAASVPLVVLNAWSIAWIVVLSGPASGAIGWVQFAGALALWGSMAWFGALALWAGVLWRGPVGLLLLGAALAVTGMSRLGLTSEAAPTIFAPLSLFGIVCTGVAWILLGVDLLVLPRTRATPVALDGRVETPA